MRGAIELNTRTQIAHIPCPLSPLLQHDPLWHYTHARHCRFPAFGGREPRPQNAGTEPTTHVRHCRFPAFGGRRRIPRTQELNSQHAQAAVLVPQRLRRGKRQEIGKRRRRPASFCVAFPPGCEIVVATFRTVPITGLDRHGLAMRVVATPAPSIIVIPTRGAEPIAGQQPLQQWPGSPAIPTGAKHE